MKANDYSCEQTDDAASDFGDFGHFRPEPCGSESSGAELGVMDDDEMEAELEAELAAMDDT